jgi:cephalosporin hydroxylase
MVVLDSYHTHDHVLKELHLYSPLVGKGFYLICGDTVVEDIPEQEHRSRPWGPGNNPATALREFFNENDRFEVDIALSNKLLISCIPGGYLRCSKD